MKPYTIIVEFVIKPEAMSAFVPLILDNAKTSLAVEAGCRRFDVLMPVASNDRVTLYEIYDNRAAFELHATSAHYADFDASSRHMVLQKTVTELATVGPGLVEAQ